VKQQATSHRFGLSEPVHIAESLAAVIDQLDGLVGQPELRRTMSSTRVAINRIVISGRALTDPVKKTVKTPRGETTLTTFSIRTAKDTYVGSVIMEIQAWERTAGQADHIKKGRTVAVDGQLTQHDYLTPDGRRQTRTAIRADRLQLLDAVPGEDCA
jgi:Single-strand binding protein family